MTGDMPRHVSSGATDNRVPLAEVMRWLLPWIVGGLLGGMLLAGLWTASRAEDEGTYAMGMAMAAVALLSLIWELETGLQGGLDLQRNVFFVDTGPSVVLLSLLASVAGLAGLIVAARVPGAATEGVGYAMATISIGLIFSNIKHYFDSREAGAECGSRTHDER